MICDETTTVARVALKVSQKRKCSIIGFRVKLRSVGSFHTRALVFTVDYFFKMKFIATFLLLAIGVACINAQYPTAWGVTTGPILAQEKIVVDSSWFQIKERTVTYRSVSTALNAIYCRCLGAFFYILVSRNEFICRMGQSLYVASCIWTIKLSHAFHRRLCKAESVKP